MSSHFDGQNNHTSERTPYSKTVSSLGLFTENNSYRLLLLFLDCLKIIGYGINWTCWNDICFSPNPQLQIVQVVVVTFVSYHVETCSDHSDGGFPFIWKDRDLQHSLQQISSVSPSCPMLYFFHFSISSILTCFT